jgi:hypothetical protein
MTLQRTNSELVSACNMGRSLRIMQMQEPETDSGHNFHDLLNTAASDCGFTPSHQLPHMPPTSSSTIESALTVATKQWAGPLVAHQLELILLPAWVKP